MITHLQQEMVWRGYNLVKCRVLVYVCRGVGVRFMVHGCMRSSGCTGNRDPLQLVAN